MNETPMTSHDGLRWNRNPAVQGALVWFIDLQGLISSGVGRYLLVCRILSMGGSCLGASEEGHQKGYYVSTAA